MGRILRFKKRYSAGIIDGSKVTTIRRSTRLREGDIVDIVVEGEVIARARVNTVKKKRVKELTDHDARSDGFKSIAELKKALRRIYGKGLRDDSNIYVIGFKVIKKNTRKME